MAIARCRPWLTTPTSRWSDPRVIFWYSLSIAFAAYYGYLVLRSAFSSAYVVQDDARQHVFWMQRFLDPGLLPGDFMADYFASQAPIGYTILYKSVAALGLHPFTFNKILPPLLGLFTTHYCFRFSLQVLPLPAAAFTSSLLLNQTLWMKDDVVSGTPRSFIYVLLLAFLVYFNERAFLPCLGVLALQPLFYPHCALLSAGVLIVHLGQWRAGRSQSSRQLQELLFPGIGLALLAVLLTPYALQNSAFGPMISPAEARTMPEFWAGGRAAYFVDNPIAFWFGDRSGFIPTPVLTPPTLAISLFFPWLWYRSKPLPWIETIRSNAAILQQLAIASFALYFAAHLWLFKLHLPSRYTHHSLRIVFALAASFTVWIWLNALMQFLERSPSSPPNLLRRGLAWGMICLLTGSLISYSSLTQSFPFTNNRYGFLPDLYQFLQATPRDTLIAGLNKETSNLQIFAQRSVLISPELGLPYHTGYYQEFRQRVGNLIAAQYSDDLSSLQTFIQNYQIDFWLIDDQTFSVDALMENRWFNQYQPEANQAIANLVDVTKAIVLRRAQGECTVLKTSLASGSITTKLPKDIAQTYWLLDAQCLLNLAESP